MCAHAVTNVLSVGWVAINLTVSHSHFYYTSGEWFSADKDMGSGAANQQEAQG
jgi:hypothetical protein